ncbi:MAG: hypothetical protein C3F08_00460 [Candidatus Methylomirabilota bacterium]|nr:MAG: hypothetical protein C3F08_00460 [candidate division NC10 bacterium]
MTDKHLDAGDHISGAETEPSDRVAAIGQRGGQRFKHVATTFSRLIRRVEFLAILDQIVVSAANFLTGAIIGRVCAKDEFGLYMLGLSIVFIVMAPQTSLISPPYTVFSPRLDASARATLTGSVVVHQLLVTALIALGLATVALALPAAGTDANMPFVIQALATVIVFILFKEFARSICFAIMDFKLALFLDAISSLLQVFMLVALAEAGSLNARTSFVAIGIASGVGAMVWLLRFRRNIEITAGDVVQDFRKHVKFGKWLFFSIVIWSLWSNSYPWILTRYHGTETTGVFAACMGVIAFANPIANAIGNFVGPRIAHSYAELGVASVRRSVMVLVIRIAWLVAPLCVILISFGNWIAIFIYGGKYAGLGLEIGVLTLSFFVTAVSMPLARSLQAMERPDVDFVVNLFPLLVMILVGIPLVKSLGVVGAACGLLAGNLVAAGARALALWRLTKRGGFPKSDVWGG